MKLSFNFGKKETKNILEFKKKIALFKRKKCRHDTLQCINIRHYRTSEERQLIYKQNLSNRKILFDLGLRKKDHKVLLNYLFSYRNKKKNKYFQR